MKGNMGNKKRSAPADLINDLRLFYRVECHFCGKYGSIGEVDKDLDYCDSVTACITFFRQGWRVVTSREFQCTATACPVCTKKKDKER